MMKETYRNSVMKLFREGFVDEYFDGDGYDDPTGTWWKDEIWYDPERDVWIDIETHWGNGRGCFPVSQELEISYISALRAFRHFLEED